MVISNPTHWKEPFYSGKTGSPRYDKIVEMITEINALSLLPPDHASSHEDGGGDEISVAGLSGVLADDQTPLAHKSSHENTGTDEISLVGLSGLLADDQNWLATIVSQAEAEAGTATTARKWTAQRVKQAIDALGGGGGLNRMTEVSKILAWIVPSDWEYYESTAAWQKRMYHQADATTVLQTISIGTYTQATPGAGSYVELYYDYTPTVTGTYNFEQRIYPHSDLASYSTFSVRVDTTVKYTSKITPIEDTWSTVAFTHALTASTTYRIRFRVTCDLHWTWANEAVQLGSGFIALHT